MNEDVADRIADSVVERARTGFDTIGEELASRLRESVSVPVGRDGKHVVRSLPGERPRRDEGDYQASLRHVTTVDGDKVKTAAGTDMERGQWLEKGTERMLARPHFQPLFDEFRSESEERARAALIDNANP